MRRIYSVLLLAFISITFSGWAQKDLTLQEAVMGRWGALAPERLSNLTWLPNSNNYAYAETAAEGQELISVNTSTFEKTTLITSTELGEKLGLEKPLTRLPRFKWINTNQAIFVFGGQVYTFNLKKREVKSHYTIPKGATNFKFRPNSVDAAYTKANNVYVMVKGVEYAVTSFNDANIVAGQTVSRVEFGIEEGLFWSPSGDKLAFYQKDESNVTNYPLVDYSTRPAKVVNTKYPMAGMPSEKVSVGVYWLSSEKTVYMNNPKKGAEDYFTALTWSPDGSEVYLATLTRNQKHVSLHGYSAQNGEQGDQLLEESNEKYVHPTHPLYFIEKNSFLWMSERNGLNQFHYYNVGGAKFSITTDDILVREFVGYDAKTKKLWFMGNYKDLIDQHLFEVKLEDGKSGLITQITRTNTYYSAPMLNDAKTMIILRSSNENVPNAYDLVELKSKSLANIFTSKDPLADYKIGATKMGTLKAADGKTTLHSRTIYPYDFDKSKKYPVLIYVYNGPGVQLLHSNWLGSAPLWMYHFANKGYIIYTVDGRGSANRGIDFEQATHTKLGVEEMKDQLMGLVQLKSEKFVDSNRIAVHGWSYGGFMTTSLLTSYPGVFNVGVAGGPVMDWSYYEVMYTERYMETPETNAEGFKSTSNILRADKLEDKLLVIHGTVDPTVVKQHSDLFLDACIKAGVQVDYFEYPGHEHNVYGQDRVHLMQKILDYIEVNNH